MTFENMKYLVHRLFLSPAALVALLESDLADGAGRRVLSKIQRSGPRVPASVLAEEFFRNFVMGEDAPRPALSERKQVLLAMIQAEEKEAFANAALEHGYLEYLVSDVYAKPAADHTDADRALIGNTEVYEVLPDIIVEMWTARKAEVCQLTEATINGWRREEYLH